MARVRFSFWAFGILAIAALALVLSTGSSISGYSEVGQQLFNMASYIVGAFILYMFVKLILVRRR